MEEWSPGEQLRNQSFPSVWETAREGVTRRLTPADAKSSASRAEAAARKVLPGRRAWKAGVLGVLPSPGGEGRGRATPTPQPSLEAPTSSRPLSPTLPSVQMILSSFSLRFSGAARALGRASASPGLLHEPGKRCAPFSEIPARGFRIHKFTCSLRLICDPHISSHGFSWSLTGACRAANDLGGPIHGEPEVTQGRSALWVQPPHWRQAPLLQSVPHLHALVLFAGDVIV